MRRGELGKNLLLAAASAVAALGFGEAGLRFAGWVPERFASPLNLVNHSRRLLLDCYNSNPRGYFDVDLSDPATSEHYRSLGVERLDEGAARAPHAVLLEYNSLHLRDRELVPKPSDCLRIFVLGDSFTEGQGVKEADTLPRLLEKLLNAGGPPTKGRRRFEVWNCGRRAADFPELRKNFERVLPFEPDIVVYAMVPNDADRSKSLEIEEARLDDWIVDRRQWLDPGAKLLAWYQPRIPALVADRVEAWRIGRATTRWYLGLYGEPNREGWERTQEHIRAMDREVRERGGRLLVATWPLLVNLEGADPFVAISMRVASFCNQAQIRHFDLRPALVGRRTESLWVHPVDHHPNEVAQRLAAESLAPVVRRIADGL